MLWRVALLTLAALLLTAGKPRHFDSHTVYRVLPTKELHVQFLNEFADEHLHDVHAWLNSLPASYPGIVTTVRAGFSFERLEILGVKISYGTGRPIAVIEGTIHAREWISTASVTWFINEILSSTDARVRSIIDQFDFYIFPVTNPDGYEYSSTANRSISTEGGASSDQCREDYAGPKALSECETKAMSEFLTSLGSDLQVYLSFHNYRQLLIYPYGSSHEVADNAAELGQPAITPPSWVMSLHPVCVGHSLAIYALRMMPQLPPSPGRKLPTVA
ncbi:zinc carboxypeptidase-like [Schistocerca serialis cubense]|uniref:zinc carboxypeptidase-like n=1 Tax=Schistocerca serialis cubense TaxID=2023355 RepID=UPI00214E1131|nr:zinc carboxypeptidase-like [Schistocerca serialis cubense]